MKNSILENREKHYTIHSQTGHLNDALANLMK